MFTGIIEKSGKVAEIKPQKTGRKLTLELPPAFSRALKIGGSLAVNGVCLTLVEKRRHRAVFQVIRETLRRSTLGALKTGDRVHVELPLKASARLDGHFVLGHVEARGKLVKSAKKGGRADLLIAYPKNFGRYLFEKGSVAVDGVSLTVGEVTSKGFWVHLIPYTLKRTHFGRLAPGESVNLEADMLAKLLADKARRPRNGLTTLKAHYKL